MHLSSSLGAPGLSDRELVARSLAGDRDAFGSIVGRYQSLVCALAYSACGNLTRSEDIAQDVFLSAWQRLRTLRDPDRLKEWLCGIARHTAVQAYRRDRREPALSGGALSPETAGPEPAPPEEAMRRDEESILWRALAELPDNYREALVLYYRENRSIESVAAALDISEENARQRLSRGRKALQDEVAAMLESALGETAPRSEFKAVVLGALPPLGPIGALKVGFAGVLSGLGGLVFPVLGMIVQVRGARPGEERQRIISMWVWLWIGCAVFVGGLLGLSIGSHHFWAVHPHRRAAILIVAVGVYSAIFGLFIWRCVTGYVRYRSASALLGGEAGPREYRSRASFLGLPLVHIRQGSEKGPARGWIAMGRTAYGGLFASGAVAVAPISLGALAFGLISLSGVGAGVFAYGAIAVGLFAMGGVAAGFLAWGGCALGWRAAAGGAVWSRNYALGSPLGSIAPHLNGPIARRAMGEMFFFHHAQALFLLSQLAVWAPMFATGWWNRRRGGTRCPQRV